MRERERGKRKEEREERGGDGERGKRKRRGKNGECRTSMIRKRGSPKNVCYYRL
jgi:hypothetical protein